MAAASLMASILCATGCEKVSTRLDVNTSDLLDQQSVKKLAVLPFTWTRPVPEEKASGWVYFHLGCPDEVVSDAVASSLLALDRYSIKHRLAVEAAIAEQGLQLAELLHKREHVRVGELVGVDAVVIGHVSAASAIVEGASVHCELAFTCSCISTENGELVWSMTGTKTVSFAGKLSPWVPILAAELTAQLAEKLGPAKPK